MVEAGASAEQLIQVVAASPFSRLPVYAGRRDAIVGLLRVKDLVDRVAAGSAILLDRLIRPAQSVQHDLPADQVLAVLRDRRAHSAIVVDQDGRAVGLVTIQDLLGELLGLSRGPAHATASDRARRGPA
jgi:CBS domain containing-hemolysin-like protein